MKRFCAIILLLLMGVQPSFAQKELMPVNSFGSNPGNLTMQVYLPAAINYDSSTHPLVVVLHGCGQSAKDIATLTQWNSLADIARAIVLYPAQKASNNIGRCFNWFNNDDIEAGKGECASIAQMIDYCRRHYNVDSSKIFITGFSAGAAMAVAMLASYPTTFKAGGIFAGGAYKIATNPFAAMSTMAGNKTPGTIALTANVQNQNIGFTGRYPPLIIFHGRNDAVVHFNNATILVAQWAGLHKADTNLPTTINAYSGLADISRTTYFDTNHQCYATLYTIDHMGHKLAIDGTNPKQRGWHTANKKFDSIRECAIGFGLIRQH